MRTAVPGRLRQHQDEIRRRDPDVQSIRYYRSTWEGYLSDDSDLAELTRRFPAEVSRADLQALSREAHADPARVRLLFLAPMVWGYGVGGHGPWRTREMLASLALKKTRQQDVLTEALAHIRAGDLHSAYGAFDVHQCGPAFSTKFFYAAGLGAGVRPLPLVLDRQVACSLRELQRDGDLVLAEWARLDRGGYVLPHADGYVRYVNSVNGWVEEMDCRPDAIEMFLFDPPASFRAEMDAETERVTAPDRRATRSVTRRHE